MAKKSLREMMEITKQLIEDEYLEKHPKRPHLVSLTKKGYNQVIEFLNKNPEMFVLMECYTIMKAKNLGDPRDGS